ncbi:MAG: hypothetical protein EBT80_09765, partial [Chitinophagales bacterium]|nr:hypothetical protein [Chitinophagales bacterium]
GQRDSLIRSISKRPILNKKGVPYTEAELRKAPKEEIQGLWANYDRGHVAPHMAIGGTDNYFAPGILMPMFRGSNRSMITAGKPIEIAKSLENQSIHPTVFLDEAAEAFGYSAGNQTDAAYQALIKALYKRGNKPFDPRGGDSFEKFAFDTIAPFLQKIKNKSGANLLDDLSRIGTVRGRQANRSAGGGSGTGSIAPFAIADDYFTLNMNNGGMVPAQNGQKYNMGGMVQGYNRGGMVAGLLGSAAVGLGGSMLGNAVGGGLGSAITMGSYLASGMIGFGGMGGRGDQKGPGFLSRQLERAVGPDTANKLKTPIGPLNSLSKASSGLAGNLGGIARVFGPVLRGFSTLLRLTSPLGLAITGVTAAIGFFIKAQKEKAAALELGRQAFGMDAAAAEKAGFKYTDYNTKIKAAIEDAQALKEKNMMIYESMTKANVPINMTIEQYKKLKEEVKSTMGSYIDLFSQTERKDVGQVAIQLKAQFMAAGDSAEVATAKIFTMIKQSENANMAASAISSNAFQSIQNMEQATTAELFANMKMPYTKALLDSIPNIEMKSGARLKVIEGRLPNPVDRPKGCGFVTRCTYAQQKCHDEHPPLVDAGNGHLYRCWYPLGHTIARKQ